MNLKNLKITLIDGSEVEQDISKEIANLIYQKTSDIGMLDIAMTLYKTGSVDLDDQQKKEVIELLDQNVKAFVKQAIFKIL